MIQFTKTANRAVWQIDSQARMFDEYRPFIPTEAYITMLPEATEVEVQEELKYGVAWDCACGFGIFGNTEDIVDAFAKIRYHMFYDLREMSDDLSCDASCTMLSRYSLPGKGLGVITGVAYSQDFSDEFLDLLKSFKDVKLILAGATYAEDKNPFSAALELVHNKKEDPILEHFRYDLEKYNHLMIKRLNVGNDFIHSFSGNSPKKCKKYS